MGEPRDSNRQRAALEAALRAALDGAGLEPQTRFAALVAGISGFDGGTSAVPDLADRAERVKIAHDTAIAHEGALDGAAGIVVIAGTGSVALGNAEPGGRFVRGGGTVRRVRDRARALPPRVPGRDRGRGPRLCSRRDR